MLMICAYGGGEFLHLLLFARPRRRGRARWQQARRYFLSALACLAASLVNPYTYHLHVHMVAVSAGPVELGSILWNSSRRISINPMAIFFEAMLVLAVAAALLARCDRDAIPSRC